MGRGSRPDCRRSWYSTFVPFPDTCPRKQPALGQTHATVFGEGRMSGEQMLTVGCGLWTTATDEWRAFPASGLAAVIYVSTYLSRHPALCPVAATQGRPATADKLSADSTPRHSTRNDTCHFAIRSQGRTRSARYKDGSSGGAASKTNKPVFRYSSLDCQT